MVIIFDYEDKGGKMNGSGYYLYISMVDTCLGLCHLLIYGKPYSCEELYLFFIDPMHTIKINTDYRNSTVQKHLP